MSLLEQVVVRVVEMSCFIQYSLFLREISSGYSKNIAAKGLVLLNLEVTTIFISDQRKRPLQQNKFSTLNAKFVDTFFICKNCSTSRLAFGKNVSQNGKNLLYLLKSQQVENIVVIS